MNAVPNGLWFQDKGPVLRASLDASRERGVTTMRFSLLREGPLVGKSATLSADELASMGEDVTTAAAATTSG
jgi:hypothetical protein